MDSLDKLLYVITPFVAWTVAGTLKFVINSIKAGTLAFKQIGYGSFPSNHMSIITSATSFAYFRVDKLNVAVTLGIAIAFIVALDAMTLRRKVGEINKHLNELNKGKDGYKPLREKMGHTPVEILGGVVVGALVGFVCANL
jgi:acid phosphatase family membrane protein YuiD